MDDDEYNSYRLRAAICPGLETEWEKPETSHWIALHKAANELRDRVGKALLAIEAVNADKSLSAEGKKAAKEKLATQALNELETGTSVARAREKVVAQMLKWQQKISVAIKPAADEAAATLHAEIRAKFGSMKEGRHDFLAKHGADPVIASALLEAPPFLANLSEGELALLHHEVDKRYLSPEIVQARSKVAKALLEAERSLGAGQAMIRQHAGLNKPTAAELAMARPQQVVA